jgi:cellulose synthase/poly-beta-1,6-N-acetylglucosamine synthase-like glycosyltransferase
MKAVFWISLFIIFYTYIGYGLIIYTFLLVKGFFFKSSRKGMLDHYKLPTCTLLIAAYNEEEIIQQKIENTLSLSYPDNLLKICFVTDGSNDRTTAILRQYPQIILFHNDERKGKVVAIDRVMKFVDSEVVVFTDANTFLNKEALIDICNHYADNSVGGVAGEKRVYFNEKADASSAGEGLYWKYESQLKALDSELYSVVGTAGELFSIRRILYEPVAPDTILDDFMISMKIAEKGYRIIYEPKAFATEMASENVKEELKRKIRIAAGGMQAIVRLKSLLNPFRSPVLTFQYISHRVLRWTITPLLLIVVLFVSFYLAIQQEGKVYFALFYLQVIFYGLAIIGWYFEKKHLKLKATFIPYYFCIMNYAALAGVIKFFKNKQSAVWVKAKRKH